MTERPSVHPAPQHLHDHPVAGERDSEGTYAEGLPGVVDGTEPESKGTVASGQSGTAGSGG
jgi:hypothetical protein